MNRWAVISCLALVYWAGGCDCPSTPLPCACLAYRATQNLATRVELFRVQADGSGLVKIALPLATDDGIGGFELSPDRTRIAFVAKVSGADWLYVASLIGDPNPVKVSAALKVASSAEGPLFHWAPDSSRLAFVADETSDSQRLFTVFPDGSGLLELATAGEIFPRWAPDSSRLAFLADLDTPGVFALYTVAPAGGAPVQVSGPTVAGGDAGDFAWAPDSSFIAYLADQDIDERFELYTVPGAGGSVTKVSGTLGPSADGIYNFQWAPDSSRVAFRVVDAIDGLSTLYSALPTGALPTLVSGAHASVGFDFRWAPDSSRLAFFTRDGLYANVPDGGELAHVSGSLAQWGHIASFGWAPDSSRLAFIAEKDTAEVAELYTVAPSGGIVTKISGSLVPGGTVEELAWAPDSSRIAFAADKDAHGMIALYTASPTGGTVDKLSGKLRLTSPISWSQDSSRVAFLASDDGQSELYSAIGGVVTKVSGPQVSGGTVFTFAW